jgi:osmotically-inducible protein OsmY
MHNQWNGSGGGKFFSGGFQEPMGEVELRPKHLSDQHIRAQIVERINLRRELRAGGIDVEVQGGRAVLRGRVATLEAKRTIEQIVEGVHGVRDVNSELLVDEA